MCSCNSDIEYNYTHFEEENCEYTVNQLQEEVCCMLTKTLEFEGRLIVCIIGLIFNTISIVLLFDKKLSGEIFNRLLLCLAILDNVYLLIGIAEIYFYVLEKPSLNELFVYFFFLYPARSITMCSIIYITIILAAQLVAIA